MHTAVAVGEIFQGKASREKKDKIETIKAENYSLYFLFDGVFALPNTSRAVAMALKFARANYAKYEKGSSFRLADMMRDINAEIVASGLPNPHTAYATVFVPVDEEGEAKASWLGEVGVCLVSNRSIVDLTRRGPVLEEKLLGMEKLRAGDFKEATIKNKKNYILLVSDGFYKFMDGNKRDDFVRIFNNPKLISVKTVVERFVKIRTFQDAAYILIKR